MTSFVLKLIAAVSMLLDHTGLILFPYMTVLRILGRLAFPLYAWCIAEGFRYTHNRRKYFLQIFLLGAACQIVYYIVDRTWYLGILITFSCSILLMEAVDLVRRSFTGQPAGAFPSLPARSGRTISVIILVCGIAAAVCLTTFVEVDYGLFGILLPVCASLFSDKKRRLICFSACLLAVAFAARSSMPIQFWSLLTIPLLILYNGKPGRIRMKMFFYIFYPAHLALLYGIKMLLDGGFFS